MQTLNYWQRFENTGKITDYLTYREYCVHTDEKYPSGEDAPVRANGEAAGYFPGYFPDPQGTGANVENARIY